MSLDTFNISVIRINVIPEFALDPSMFPANTSNIVSTVDLLFEGSKEYISNTQFYSMVQGYANTANVTLEQYVQQYPALKPLMYSSIDDSIKIENVHIPYEGGNTANLVPYTNLTQNTIIEWASNTLIKMNGANAIIDIQTQLENTIDTKINVIKVEKSLANTTPALPW